MEEKGRETHKCQRHLQGLETPWSDEEFSLESSFETQHWIYTELHHITSKITLSLFNLYVPVLQLEKKYCWLTLVDFIEIDPPKEKRGGNKGKDQMLPLVEDIMQ